MKRGEIWRVQLPPTSGREQSGQRPALLVQDTALIVALPTVLVVPLTSTLATTRFAGTLRVDPTPENGLTMPSIALVFQLRAIDKQALLTRLGVVDDDTLQRIDAQIDTLLGR